MIVVEKLTKNVNDGHIHEIFGAYGPIKDLDLPMNRQFMTNRGTAYILYTNSADAEAAIAHMHEAQLDGAVLNVSIVLPRRKFSQSPPPAHRGAPHFDRSDNRGPPPGGYWGGPPGMVADLTLAIAISILIDPALTRDRGHHDALDPDRFHLSLEAILPHGVVVGIGAGNRHQPRVEVDEEEVRVTQAILAIAIEVAAGTEAGVGAGTGGEGDTRSDV
ncbi:MAG: hypothetical protein L6R39_005593 [Caloplaca ligustica]|nr:MAG: hypothetical protein L6R39_005593 [Caloplaca ligustica]